jgi:hypothetical protein
VSGKELETEGVGRPALEPEKETLLLGPGFGGKVSQTPLAQGEKL